MARPPLPVFKILLASYAVLWSRRAAALRLQWLPCVLLTLTAVAAEHAWPAGAGVVKSLTWLATLVLLAGFMRATLRLVLLGGAAEPGRGILPWRSAHTRFFAWLLCVNCLSLVGVAFGVLVCLQLPAAARPVLLALLAVAALYVAARLALVLPACALGHPSSLERAWALGRGHGGALAMLMAVTVLLVPGLPAWLLGDAGRAGDVAGKFLAFVLLGPGVATLGLVYHCLLRMQGEAAGP